MSSYRVIYNQYTFVHPTVSISESPVVDEQGTLVAVVNEITVSGVIAATSISGFVTAVTEAQCKLNTPRKPLTIQWSPDGGSTWYTSFAVNSEVQGGPVNDDINFGPIPGPLRIDRFAGGLSAFVEWTCTATTRQCFDGLCNPFARPAEIVSVTRRWSFSYDASGFCTRTVSGKLVVTSAAALNGKPADAFRNWVVPAAPVNFEPGHQEWLQSESGRELIFSVTHVERMWTAPPPVTEPNVSFEIRVPDLFSGDRRFMATLSLSGSFRGPASVGKGALVRRLGELVQQKFGLDTGAVVIPGSWTLGESVYDNAITFSITAYRPIGDISTGNFDATSLTNIPGLDALGLQPPNSNGRAQPIGAYGADGDQSSGVIAPPIKLYDPCAGSPAPGSFSGPGLTPVNQAPGVGSGTPNTIGETLDSGSASGISQVQQENPFIALHEITTYSIDNKIAVFLPKKAGADPVIQQTANPTLTVIYVGYRKQVARTASEVLPPPPPPLVAAGVGKVLVEDVSLPTADPVGPGTWNVYTTKWRYVVLYTKAIKQTDLSDVNGTGPVFPQDPSRPPESDAQRKLPPPPDGFGFNIPS